VIVPLGFLLGAWLLGPVLAHGTGDDANTTAMLSVPIAWAIAYPIAFALLQYLVQQSIDLPIGQYVRATSSIVACAVVGLALGYAVSLAVGNAGDAVRMITVGGSALAGTFAMLAYWQKITPRSIKASLK
jgi:hypothetical protein